MGSSSPAEIGTSGVECRWFIYQWQFCSGVEVPWFAEWFIHLSLLAARARGIPISAPTSASFLPYLAARAEGGRREGLTVCLSSPLQEHPLGSALGGVFPGDDAGGGGRAYVTSEKPPLTIMDLFKMPQESDCFGLKCCLCCLLVVWPLWSLNSSSVMRE